MNREFVRNNSRFKIKGSLDIDGIDEATIDFKDIIGIKRFLSEAKLEESDFDFIRQINRVTDTTSRRYCRIKSPENIPAHPSELCRSIKSRKLSVVAKDRSLSLEELLYQDAGHFNGNEVVESLGLEAIAQKCARQLAKVYNKITIPDIYIFEKTIRIEEGKSTLIPIVVDPTTIQLHTTGWKSWDDPFNILAFGALKGVVAFNVAHFLKLSESQTTSLVLGAQSDLLSGQYLVSGKSIIQRKWYGTFALRYNVKSGYWEIPWVKYEKSGAPERTLIELTRKDRIVFHKKVIREYPEMLLPPFQTMSDFLSKVKEEVTPPETDVARPIKVGRFFKFLR